MDKLNELKEEIAYFMRRLYTQGLTTTSGAYGSGMNPRPTWGVTVCDVDSDGDPDLITSSYGRQTNMLWKNLNGTEFENVAPAVGYAMDDEQDFSDNQFYRCHCQRGWGHLLDTGGADDERC